MKTPEDIIKILRSIKKLEFDNTDGLHVWFEGDETSSVPQEFESGSFTEQLLLLIEEELSKEQYKETWLNG